MNGYGVKKIICMDPHAYNLIQHDYRDLGGHYEIFHYFEILDRLLQAGRRFGAAGRRSLRPGLISFQGVVTCRHLFVVKYLSFS